MLKSFHSQIFGMSFFTITHVVLGLICTIVGMYGVLNRASSLVCLYTLLSFVESNSETSNRRMCIDWQGFEVDDNENFIPNGNDPCFTCNCMNGTIQACSTAACYPENCRHNEIAIPVSTFDFTNDF